MPAGMSGTPIKQQSTAAFHAQAVVSFAVSLAATAVGTVRLDAGVRALLAVAVLYPVTSALTLAKVIRDRQEAGRLANRADQARPEELLAAHDPFEKP